MEEIGIRKARSAPLTEDDAAALANQLVQKKRRECKAILRSVCDEGKTSVFSHEIEFPPGHFSTQRYCNVQVYKKTGVTKSFPTR
jgi:hypothetical protein